MQDHEIILAQHEERRKKRMGGFATTAERNAHIATLYSNGVLSPEIAKTFGISRQRVWQILKAHGIEPKFKTAPSADKMVELIRGGSFIFRSIDEVAGLMRITRNMVRSRLSKHPEWSTIRQEMRERRAEDRRRDLRVFVTESYRKLVAELGRPASLDEMAGVRIFKTTLSRLYGPNYVRKFREEMGEVG